jgi:DNA polymerase-3 subunit beta
MGSLSKGNARMQIGQNKILLILVDEKGSEVQVHSKLVEGNYPNYQQVIPAELKHQLALGREAFLAAVRRAELMTNEKSSSVKFSFTKNKLEISANTPELGESRETMDVQFRDEMEIAFNPAYVIAALKVVDQDEITLGLIDGLSPGVITAPNYTYVIMPMRLT